MFTKKQLSDIKATIGHGNQGTVFAFQALGDPGRYQIFKLLLEYHDMCVTDIANVFGITVSAASQQLRVLERLGLIVRVRMGQMICYEKNDKNPITKQLIKLMSIADEK